MAKENGSATVTDVKAPAPPYIPFSTFMTLIEKLQAGGMPQRIDRSVWGPFMSGSYGPYLMSGLRFMGLIDDADRPTQDFENLVDQADARKMLLSLVIQTSYKKLLDEVDLSRATPGLLLDAFRDIYGLEGSARRKAYSFFVHAAQFVELRMSGHVHQSARRRRTLVTKGRRKAAAPPPPPPLPPARPAGSGLSRTVVFPGAAGQVTLNLDVDPFEVDEDQRQFYTDLIDRFKLYERDHPAGAQAGAHSSGDGEVGPA